MKETLPPMDEFFPLLIGTYIRIATVVKCLKAEEAGGEYAPQTTKFKISKEDYTRLRESGLDSPLLGLTLEYDEDKSLLSVAPDKYVLDLYTNKIMREVALQQAEDFKNRYSKFITLQEE